MTHETRETEFLAQPGIAPMDDDLPPLVLSAQPGTPLPFVDADAMLDSFEELLTRHGVAIAIGSPFEDIRLTLTEYLALHRREMAIAPQPDKRGAWTRMLGLVDLASKIGRASRTRFFDRLVPHLKLLGERDADPSQNASTGSEDQANHKLFELLVGAAAATFADDLDIEGPRASATRTPDVTLTVDGIRWGVACKVIHSHKTTTYRDRIIDGITQIDRADVDRGLVLLNVKNLFSLEELLPFGQRSEDEPYEVFETQEAALRWIAGFCRRLLTRLGEEGLDIANAFATSRRTAATPQVGHYFSGMLFYRREGQPTMFPFVLLYYLDFFLHEAVTADSLTNRFRELLNVSLQWGPREGVEAVLAAPREALQHE